MDNAELHSPYTAKPVALSIAAVERDTGLSKDILRIWERRYGFPAPQRDALGERSYPFEQVERLRTIKRLLEAGHRPGRVVSMSAEELQRLAATLSGTAGSPAAAQPAARAAEAVARQTLISAVESNDVEGFRREAARILSLIGLSRFVLEVVAPVNVDVGDAWMHGRLEVFQEHLYTESMQVLLRDALRQLPPDPRAVPRVLLGTVNGEPHALGLLMAEAMLALEGCRCVSLGTQTPVWDVARAAAALDVQIVALSFTGCLSPNQVSDALVELRAKLPPAVRLWAGGSAPVLQRRAVSGVRAMPRLDAVGAAIAEWRRMALGGAAPQPAL
jgi:methanogenic corrinoid protein MtbC1